MLNKKQLQQLLMKVSEITCSGEIRCKPENGSRSPWTIIKDAQQTRKAIKLLHKKYPEQKLSKRSNLLQHLALLYVQARQAYKNKDPVKMHRYFSGDIYQSWRTNSLLASKSHQSLEILPNSQLSSNHLIFYQFVNNINLKKAVVFENECQISGKKNEWFQCWIQLLHQDEKSGSRIWKNHVVERKLNYEVLGQKKWYFCEFEN